MKPVIALAIVFFLAAPFLAMAGEPAWWTQQKQKCGISSGTAYNTWVSQGSPCNSGGGSSGGISPSGELGRVLGTALGNALADAIRGNPQEEARQQAEQQNQLAQQEAERRRVEEQLLLQSEEKKNRLLGGMMNVGESSQLELMGVDSGPGLSLMMGDQSANASLSLEPITQPVKPPDSSQKSAGFTKGVEDASQCYSQNSGPSCIGLAVEQQENCLTDYRAGYGVGDKQRARLMVEARKAGELAGSRGELANGASSPAAEGPCRVEWIKTYNQGYFQGKNANLQ